MTHSLPPYLIGFIDQVRAKTDDELTELVSAFREHVDHHDGDTMCAYGTTVIGAHPISHLALCELLAAAVARIARLETEAKTGTGGPL